MAEEQVYKSSYAGTIIDRAVAWVNQHMGVNLTKLKGDFDTEVQQRTAAINGVNNRITELGGIANNAAAKAQEAKDAVTTVNGQFGKLEITRSIASDGLYIGIKFDGTTIHTEKIPPITFSGLNEAGKNARYGIVDRDFVNDLKAWVKLCVNDKLPESEDFRAEWNKGLQQAKENFQQQIKTQDGKIQGLEVYKELFDTKKEEV